MIKMGQLSVQLFQYRYPNRPGLSKTDELVEIGANPKSRSFTSPANVTDLSPREPKATVTLGWVMTSPTVYISMHPSIGEAQLII